MEDVYRTLLLLGFMALIVGIHVVVDKIPPRRRPKHRMPLREIWWETARVTWRTYAGAWR